MLYEIKWSKEALADYKNILEYLNTKWGKSSVLKFQRIIEKEIEMISVMPRIFSFINRAKELRRCVLVKQVSLYYLEIDQEIFIVRLLDNRQDPKSIKKELKKFNSKDDETS